MHALREVALPMSNCPVCLNNEMFSAGCHVFCSKCGYAAFEVNQDYIAASTVLLATLVGSSKFDSPKGVAATVELYVEQHLPLLDAYVSSMVAGRDKFIMQLTQRVMEQAKNMVVGEEADPDMCTECNAGDKDIYHLGNLQIRKCTNCDVNYKLDGSPFFICSCGCIQYEYIDTEEMNVLEPGIVQCPSCSRRYWNNNNGSFTIM
jgi:hypothetical protein